MVTHLWINLAVLDLWSKFCMQFQLEKAGTEELQKVQEWFSQENIETEPANQDEQQEAGGDHKVQRVGWRWIQSSLQNWKEQGIWWSFFCDG